MNIGIAFMAVSLAAFATLLAGFALNLVGVGVAAMIIALVSSGIGMAYLNNEGRRQRGAQRWRR